MACSIALAFMSCENQKFNDTFVDSERVHVDTLSTELQKVRDYVPQYAVVAHRGSTYWTPEETEAAYRWAREMGADYLEADLQVSKDGVILALHENVPQILKMFLVKDSRKKQEGNIMTF